MKNKFVGLALISFLFSIAGIVISALLLKEDVTSTAHTIFEYFPSKYGVTPASTWQGAIILGVFTSVLQVVAASVAFGKFSIPSRGVAAIALVASLAFDNWTDIVFRSGNLTGNMEVAIVTTLAFYTIGSEITQGLSWLVFAGTWRVAISDFMWGWAKFGAGWQSIGSEWKNFQRAARNKEFSERNTGIPRDSGDSRPNHPNSQPVSRFIVQNQGKHPQNKPNGDGKITFPFKK